MRVTSGFSVHEALEVDFFPCFIGSFDIESERLASLSDEALRCFSSSEVTRCWMTSSRLRALDESV